MRISNVKVQFQINAWPQINASTLNEHRGVYFKFDPASRKYGNYNSTDKKKVKKTQLWWKWKAYIYLYFKIYMIV